MPDTIGVNKIIVGITGANGSGKDTVCDLLVEKYKAKKLVFSDLLKEAMLVFVKQEEIGRRDYAWLSTALRKRFGEGILGVGMKKKILNTETELIVISGVRDFGELEMIRSFPKGKLVAVKTDLKTRWERLQVRKAKADDAVGFEEFKKELEKLPSEKQIERLSADADYVLNNNGSREELDQQLEDLVQTLKKL